MSREDHLKKQIDQLSVVLKEALNRLMGNKSSAAAISIEDIKVFLDEAADLDINKLLHVPPESFSSALIPSQWETLADLFHVAAGNDTDESERKKHLNKSLEIYTYLDKSTQTYSFERAEKIRQVLVALTER